ncbi:divalent-cation tolerance protein CutA [Bdellovibrio svalbardensis]|uniref:Divalent-cation tolerance protein CutA n=1 Tax=Bdellovibrio svalbardensis TaxID=2972972 RepID=A0ABT6DMA5_9BACT|nr:divalent-cation tolerance protein CutA [Bdellovibrio svalbardensis]MDG0818010.1 divalent-cation tolerance protein CutA [Bdellovibrio svalbardensis]
MSQNISLFYIPCPDQATAEKISRTLLEEKLIGCANIIPGMTSMYWWEGKIATSSESILILKTSESSDALKNLEKRVLELHPYDIPCLMQLPVAAINSAYQKWLEESQK